MCKYVHVCVCVSEPLGSVEIDLFQAALPFCLKVDSAPFRQKLLTSLRKVFVRVRDSCLTAIKRKTKDPFVGRHANFFLQKKKKKKTRKKDGS